GQNNKYGYFPSAALAWRVSGEDFLKDVSLINDLKLRVSYGTTGNNNIGGYNHIATISYLRTVLGGAPVQGYAPSRLDNPLLTWEVQTQVNGGLDFTILNNRLSLTLDYYRSRNTDLLLNVNIPATTGFTRTLKNIGEVQNRGFDVHLTTVNINSKNFRWSTNFNISHFTNEVVKLGPTGDPITSSSHITQIGQPIGMYYGYLTDGVFMNQAEVDRGPLFGSGTANQSRPGDIRFVDVNGDKIINSLDQDVMGNPYPDFYYGMTNDVSWKNLSLSVSFYGSYGNEILNLAGNGILNKRGNRVGQLATQLDFWKTEKEPGDGNTPRPNDASTGGNRNLSQHFIDKGSFLRINNLKLNYAVPVETLRNLFNTNLSAQIYCNISNLYTFTNNETCFNPDVSNSRDALTPGVSYSDYPLPRTIVFGINLKF
ncbi:MAG: TonB-dependent receptor, partial [Tannerellaceae bacterium]|nr:TonB-dependent receptor [Tannerellaceae bacterium]